MRRTFILLAGLAITTGAAAAQPLGRLFFTPAERAQLDVARTQKKPPPQLDMAEPAQPPTPPTQIITYSGIVRRSDGKAILWLNNRPVEEKEALAGLAVTGRVRPDGAVTLQVPHTGGSIDLKVGQRAELASGKVGEARPPAAAPKPAAPAPKPPETEGTEKKTEAPEKKSEPLERKSDPSAPVGLKMDLGNRALEGSEEQRLSRGRAGAK